MITGMPTNTPFNTDLLYTIIADLRKQLPREGCGMVVNDEYIPCNNISKSDDHFEIDVKDYVKYLINDEIQCIVHSHNNEHNASETDMRQQASTGIPWGIFNYVDGKIDDIVFWGDTVEPLPLVGRRFWYGIHDCFSIPRDWWRLRGFNMINHIRDGNWNKNGTSNLIIDSLEKTGWFIIDQDDMEAGDGLLIQTRSGNVSHLAIYDGGGYLIHQLSAPGVLSRIDLINIYTDKIKHVVRFKPEEEIW